MDQTDDPLARIYSEKAAEYEALVSHEDYEGNLLPSLERIRPSAGLDIADLGAGTGRLACMLAPSARSLYAFDVSPPMLAVAHRRLRVAGPRVGASEFGEPVSAGVHYGSAEPVHGDESGRQSTPGTRNWQIGVADHRALPLGAGSVDLAVSGWSIVYTVVWHEETWQHELGRALAEMERVLRPGGTVIILETMGTGYTTPHPPDNLLPYFAYLEGAGFASTWIRTDYAFANRDEASALAGLFFGEAIVERCEGAAPGTTGVPVILPECTGIWWRAF